MRILLVVCVLACMIPPVLAQDYLSTQGATLPGTVTLKDGKTITGKVSYSYGGVSVQAEASPVVTYKAEEVKEFVLDNGGGEFISIASGKKMRSAFYEIIAYKNGKLMFLSNVTKIEDRGKEKDQFGHEITVTNYLYSPEDKQLLNADLKEISAFLSSRCKGIATAITEYKDKAYHYGALANEEERTRKLMRIADDYNNDRCTYIPKDY